MTSPLRPALTGAVLLCLLTLTGCSSPAPEAAIPTSYPPIASGSTDPKTGAVADGLIAKVVDPPSNTRQVEKSPDASLEKPLSIIGCGATQRTVFWVADHWTLNALHSWLVKHPVDGLTDDTSSDTDVVQRVMSNAPSAAPEVIAFRLVRLDGGSVGVRVQAEVGPSTPCAHTQDGAGTGTGTGTD